MQLDLTNLPSLEALLRTDSKTPIEVNMIVDHRGYGFQPGTAILFLTELSKTEQGWNMTGYFQGGVTYFKGLYQTGSRRSVVECWEEIPDALSSA